MVEHSIGHYNYDDDVDAFQELELALEAERRSAEDAKQAVVLIERKRAQIQKEFEDVRSRVDSVRHPLSFLHRNSNSNIRISSGL